MTTDIYRILTPSEYEALVKAIPKAPHEMQVRTMMNTGMRYEELLAFAQHLGWFDARNNAISLPASYTKTLIGRTVHLTPAFSKDLEKYLKRNKGLDFPNRANMGAGLKRWWLLIGENPSSKGDLVQWYPLPKTFRKSWESYLLMADYSIHKVALSQGHTVAVSEHHYANLSPKLKSEMEKVKELTAGWGT